MTTKRQEATAHAFNRGAIDEAVALGATRVDHPIWDYAAIIDTRCGPLEIHAAANPTSLNRPSGRRGVRSHLFTVFCRFKDIDRMREGGCSEMAGVNRYSGKYNYHAGTDSPEPASAYVDEALNGFRAHLERVL